VEKKFKNQKNEKKIKKRKTMEKNAPFVCKLQPPISDLHMARRGGEVPY
jgi:hypothetical protein